MYETFIGLEVHIHLLTKTKVFCGCRAAFGDEPNSNICPVCMGYPGVLPSLNKEAMRMGCTVARALNCRIPERTWFDRKQYFYPDMTKNYQISQFANPLGQEGWIEIEDRNISKRVRIRECHLEEDAGKMMHTGTVSLLDYNRAGVALLEIVTEPDMCSGEEAELFIQQLRRLVRYLGVCDGNMEEGSLRADANISINNAGSGLGKKVEIKNLNSSRFVRLGLNYERERQGVLLDEGKEIIQETRLWNENRDRTEVMRTKENANDYRYFPEPDLPVFIPDAAFIDSVEAGLVELPLERVRRFKRDWALNGDHADALCEEKALADYFEAALAAVITQTKGLLSDQDAAQKTANWILTDIKHLINREKQELSAIGALKLTPARLAAIISLTARGELSSKNAKQTAFAIMSEDKDAEVIIKEKGWAQISDPAIIGQALEKVYAAEQKTFKDARDAQAAGNAKRFTTLNAYLVGKLLAETHGRANPEIAGKLVAERMACSD
ncbi:MAG: Asp-tRNA(Asn)/Glu-tRNA(Gln) amidotransferase subunit GatB [Spirochaetaceae bacterium]|jgi:aspartyl-tRNA(Asn)/glutamyl-tRNA(Gln) amidotransferase subunit B|nr:Asp-tRNA(Asn)/Glu-tRNA(Gln) amidotransferase subunit GatB [Spirochaetaceae bacterium]